MTARRLLSLLVFPLLLAGCERLEEAGAVEPLTASQAPPRVYDTAVLERGRNLYAQHCAACHGADAEGDPQWRERRPDGRFRPPPLNGSGHAWHHPWRQLHQIVKHGRDPRQSDMPGWGDRLSDADIDAILSWLQSLWPEPAYQGWYRIDQKSRRH